MGVQDWMKDESTSFLYFSVNSGWQRWYKLAFAKAVVISGQILIQLGLLGSRNMIGLKTHVPLPFIYWWLSPSLLGIYVTYIPRQQRAKNTNWSENRESLHVFVNNDFVKIQTFPPTYHAVGVSYLFMYLLVGSQSWERNRDCKLLKGILEQTAN